MGKSSAGIIKNYVESIAKYMAFYDSPMTPSEQAIIINSFINDNSKSNIKKYLQFRNISSNLNEGSAKDINNLMKESAGISLTNTQVNIQQQEKARVKVLTNPNAPSYMISNDDQSYMQP